MSPDKRINFKNLRGTVFDFICGCCNCLNSFVTKAFAEERCGHLMKEGITVSHFACPLSICLLLFRCFIEACSPKKRKKFKKTEVSQFQAARLRNIMNFYFLKSLVSSSEYIQRAVVNIFKYHNYCEAKNKRS